MYVVRISSDHTFFMGLRCKFQVTKIIALPKTWGLRPLRSLLGSGLGLCVFFFLCPLVAFTTPVDLYPRNMNKNMLHSGDVSRESNRLIDSYQSDLRQCTCVPSVMNDIQAICIEEIC